MDEVMTQRLIDQRNHYFHELLKQSFKASGFTGSLFINLIEEPYKISDVKMYYVEGNQVFDPENEDLISDGDVFRTTHVINFDATYMAVDYRLLIGDKEHPHGQWKMAYENDEDWKDF